MDSTITTNVPISGWYYYSVSFKFHVNPKWIGLRTPKPFEEGQYLVDRIGHWSKIQAVKDGTIEVINANCCIMEREMSVVRGDIKDGTTRQLNKTEMLLYRMLHE